MKLLSKYNYPQILINHTKRTRRKSAEALTFIAAGALDESLPADSRLSHLQDILRQRGGFQLVLIKGQVVQHVHSLALRTKVEQGDRGSGGARLARRPEALWYGPVSKLARVGFVDEDHAACGAPGLISEVPLRFARQVLQLDHDTAQDLLIDRFESLEETLVIGNCVRSTWRFSLKLLNKDERRRLDVSLMSQRQQNLKE